METGRTPWLIEDLDVLDQIGEDAFLTALVGHENEGAFGVSLPRLAEAAKAAGDAVDLVEVSRDELLEVVVERLLANAFVPEDLGGGGLGAADDEAAILFEEGQCMRPYGEFVGFPRVRLVGVDPRLVACRSFQGLPI